VGTGYSAVTNGQWVEYIPQLALITRVQLIVEDGYAHPSKSSGLGIDWDWDAIDNMQLVNIKQV
jgi:L-alanine-DL-glutamate epimerase-like enolase superfamily enzyme